MGTPPVVTSSPAEIGFMYPELVRAVSVHLAAVHANWMGLEVMILDGSASINVKIDGDLHLMDVRGIVVSSEIIEHVVMTTRLEDEYLAVTFVNEHGDWRPLKRVYRYDGPTFENEDEWDTPPLSEFLD